MTGATRSILVSALGAVLIGAIAGLSYASSGSNPLVSFPLLAVFASAIAVCLILLVRLFSRSGELFVANAALARRNKEIERANQAKSRFLANMSHELRTPLNAIIGFTDLMQSQEEGGSAEHRGFLRDIRSSADHLLDLINEVLDLARIESGRITLEPVPIDPERIATECVDGVRALAAEGDITLTLESGAMETVLLDPARLRQVLLNYLSNAIKFTPPGGYISATVRRESDELVIEVADSGPGIDAADQGRVFREFEQIDSNGKRHPGGTGLGLAVTKRVVEAQRGVVGVRSTKACGSTFYARLPVVSYNGVVGDAPKESSAPQPEMAEAGER